LQRLGDDGSGTGLLTARLPATLFPSTPRENGTREVMGRVTIRVSPRSGRDSVTVEAGTIVVRVRAVADKGEANEAASRTLAAALGVPRSSVSLVRGSRSRIKMFDVDGLDQGAVLKRLEAL
jgi:uncharacterized protein YggU (UPF0235/DUF167 family)